MVKHRQLTKKGIILCSTRQKLLIGIIFISLLNARASYAQSAPVEPATQTTYPKVVGYLSFILPLATIQGSTTSTESQTETKIGFPTGVNVFYSAKFGFSYEFTPTITFQNQTNKMSNLLFDPGPMFRCKHGFTFIPRLAFETGGRYGFTPVFNEVYLRTKAVNYFVAMSIPARYGDNELASYGLNLQIGFIFN